MSICSIQFLLFTGLILTAYYLLPARAGGLQPYLLLAASLFFFWTLSGWATGYLLLTALVSWLIARGMERFPGRKKLLLVLELLIVLGLLIVLKYHGFISQSLLRGRLAGLEMRGARFLLLS